MRRASFGTAFALGSALVALPATAQEASPLRSRLDSMGRAIERAVEGVSRAGRFPLGPGAPLQGVHIEGVGVVFVLPPRALASRAVVRRRPMRETRPAAPPAAAVADPATVEGTLPAAAAPPALEQLERELQQELAARARLMQQLQQAQRIDDELVQRVMDLEMRAVNEQAEAFRVEAERARQRAERTVRGRLAGGGPAPAGPDAKTAAAGAEPAPAGGAPLLVLPASEAPWRLWLEAEPAETRPPEEVVAVVREAIVSALEGEGARLKGMDPRESVTVAVDFVLSERLVRRPRVRRTLVVRVPYSDVEARLAGELTPAAFRQRVVAREY